MSMSLSVTGETAATVQLLQVSPEEAVLTGLEVCYPRIHHFIQNLEHLSS